MILLFCFKKINGNSYFSTELVFRFPVVKLFELWSKGVHYLVIFFFPLLILGFHLSLLPSLSFLYLLSPLPLFHLQFTCWKKEQVICCVEFPVGWIFVTTSLWYKQKVWGYMLFFIFCFFCFFFIFPFSVTSTDLTKKDKLGRLLEDSGQ